MHTLTVPVLKDAAKMLGLKPKTKKDDILAQIRAHFGN
jgi:hypothetical protein